MILGIDDIMRALPHRYPFLMVDKVLELEKGKSITATKMVTATEPHFRPLPQYADHAGGAYC